MPGSCLVVLVLGFGAPASIRGSSLEMLNLAEMKACWQSQTPSSLFWGSLHYEKFKIWKMALQKIKITVQVDTSYWRWLNQNIFVTKLGEGTREASLVSNVPMAFSPSVFQSTIKTKPHWLRKILPCCAVIQSRFLRSPSETFSRLGAPGITTGSECEWSCQREGWELSALEQTPCSRHRQ